MKKIIAFLLLSLAFVSVTPLGAAAATPVPAPKQEQPVEQAYWLTIKSGIRHNSKCKYFHNSKGRPCNKDEGRACKICGG